MGNTAVPANTEPDVETASATKPNERVEYNPIMEYNDPKTHAEVFFVGQQVERRDFGMQWGTGFVTSVEPLLVTDISGSHAWAEVRSVVEVRKCAAGHALAAHTTPEDGYGCDKCHRHDIMKGTTLYECRICNYDECEHCNSLTEISGAGGLEREQTDAYQQFNLLLIPSPATSPALEPPFPFTSPAGDSSFVEEKLVASSFSSPAVASFRSPPVGPSMGRPDGRTPVIGGPIADPGYARDTPDHLKMPPGSDFAVGTALPNDSHGYNGERDELGQRHGDGVQLFSDGRRYSGQFENNTFHGGAIMEWPDGHRYTGQYENNHKSGNGFFLWPDGRFYDGQWKMGQRHGHGKYIATESYIGDYFEGFRHGDGVLTWPDGKRYAGQFFRGALHGSAVMSWPDGRRYLGQYLDNQKQGEGVFYWPDGRLFDGGWRKGLRHGSSRFIDKSGVEQVGKWHKDRLISSQKANHNGIHDPLCEPPSSLFERKSKLKEELARIEEEQSHPPAPLSALSSGDVVLSLTQGADSGDSSSRPQEKPPSAGCTALELHHLRNMALEDLREHANGLHRSFGHLCSVVPDHDHGLVGWIYEVQSRHLRPLLGALPTASNGSQSPYPAASRGGDPEDASAGPPPTLTRSFSAQEASYRSQPTAMSQELALQAKSPHQPHRRRDRPETGRQRSNVKEVK